VLLLFWGLTGCSLTPGRHGKQTEKGKASWYGNEYHGRPTASGEVFDENDLTAAHAKYPFGTIVRVKNLNNGKTVDVRINDRGPTRGGRIIDLSKAAARQIDMIREGVVPVRIEVLRWGRR
jgi:rare lipoprotein A